MAKGAYVGVSNVARKVKQPYIGVNNVARKVKSGYIGVGGAARQFFKGGKSLSDFAQGDVVYLNENGTPVAFWVAKHNYESGLNGAGRTLLVRQSLMSPKREWDNRAETSYESCTMDAYLNGEYKQMFDTAVRNAMSTTAFYYTPGYNGDEQPVTSLSRSVFLLSLTEWGTSHANAHVEGTALPIASTMKSYLVLNTLEWTRSMVVIHTNRVFAVKKANSGFLTGQQSQVNQQFFRPCFTLPSSAVFNEETSEFVSA